MTLEIATVSAMISSMVQQSPSGVWRNLKECGSASLTAGSDRCLRNRSGCCDRVRWPRHRQDTYGTRIACTASPEAGATIPNQGSRPTSVRANCARSPRENSAFCHLRYSGRHRPPLLRTCTRPPASRPLGARTQNSGNHRRAVRMDRQGASRRERYDAASRCEASGIDHEYGSHDCEY